MPEYVIKHTTPRLGRAGDVVEMSPRAAKYHLLSGTIEAAPAKADPDKPAAKAKD